jgi:predicted N-formylglutamate amidohydrolase
MPKLISPVSSINHLNQDRKHMPTHLLTPEDGAPFEIFNPDGKSPLVLICEHASRRMPVGLGQLGMNAAALETHIAWDPDARAVAEKLALMLDAPLVAAGFSRLVLDLNRPLDSDDLIPERCGDIEVPGNRQLDGVTRQVRIDTLYHPFHLAVDRIIEQKLCQGQRPMVVPVHSFTPHLAGQQRPWHIGVMWERDGGLASPFLQHLAVDTTLCIGLNQPYTAHEYTNYTLQVHGESRGLPCLMLEIRQDVIDSPSKASEYSRLIGSAIQRCMPLLPGLAGAVQADGGHGRYYGAHPFLGTAATHETSLLQ